MNDAVRTIGAVFALSIAAANELAAAQLVWADPAEGRIYRSGVDGTGVGHFSAPGNLGAVAAGAGRVYWTYPSSIGSAGADGSDAPDSPPFTDTARALTASGTRVFWTTNNADGTDQVRSFDFATSTFDVFATPDADPQGIAAAGSVLLWADPTDGMIHRSDFSGNALGSFSAAFNTGVIAASGGRVYWSRGSSIASANLDGSDMTASPPFTDAVDGLAADGSRVFWTTTSGSGQEQVRSYDFASGTFGAFNAPGVRAQGIAFIPEPTGPMLLCGALAAAALRRNRRRR